jgi:hypothetical protein
MGTSVHVSESKVEESNSHAACGANFVMPARKKSPVRRGFLDLETVS